MNFEDEPYVRLYVRDTLSWKRLGWEGQAVFCLMLRKVDRAGILEGTGNPVEDVVLFIDMPHEIVRIGLDRLIKQGIVEVAGESLILPKFIEAQAVVRGPKERQRECRERKRDMARLGLDPQQRGAVIYFIQSELGGPIKIGRATDLAKRLVGLATGRPDTLTVLASFAGTVADERTLHSRLAPYRAKGEWFQDCPEVLAVVAYAAQHGAAVMPWLVSRDLSQPVTAKVTQNKNVTLAQPSSSELVSAELSVGPPRARPCVATSEPDPEPGTPEPMAPVAANDLAPPEPPSPPRPGGRVYDMPEGPPPQEYLDEAWIARVSREQAISTWEHYQTAKLPLDGVQRLHSWLLAQARTYALKHPSPPARASPRGRGQNPRASKQPSAGMTGLEGVEIVNGIAVPRQRPAEEAPR